MRKNKEIQTGHKLFQCVLAVVLIMTMMLFMECFTLITHAQSQGKVTVAAAKIRKEADANSEAIGSAAQGVSVTINSEVTGTDGNIWYQVNVDADKVGYIRSDLVEKTEGGSGSTTTPPATAPTAQVSPVQPQSATVTGAEDVRVRADASTASSIVTTIKNGGAMTVTGQTTGSDAKTWYEVKYIDNGSEVTGFIRSDYVALSGELLPADTPQAPEGDGAGEGTGEDTPPLADPPQETKEFDTKQEGDAWYLLNNGAGKQYNITDLLDAAEKNAIMLQDSLKTVNTQKIVIIVLVILAAGMSLAVTMLILKMKDIKDEAYFSAVENETIRGRNVSSGKGGNKVMHSVGTGDGKPSQVRPAGTRPGGTKVQSSQDVARPGASGTSQLRPMNQNPQNQGQARPAAPRPQGTPRGNSQGTPQGGTAGQGRVPSARPEGAQQVRAGVKPQGAAPVKKGDHQAPGGQARGPRQDMQSEPKQSWKSKNFMTDDDEFEFEFLNWDGDDN